jgi:hypothetical protein
MPTAYSGVDIGLQDAFWELICADEDLLRLEFDEIVSVEVPPRDARPGPSTTPDPPSTAQSTRRLPTRPPRKPGGSERAPPDALGPTNAPPAAGGAFARSHRNGAGQRAGAAHVDAVIEAGAVREAVQVLGEPLRD